MDVALGLGDFDWVEWKEAAILEAPLYEPGRFLARPDNPTSHLQRPADSATPITAHPYRHVPHYSSDLDEALPAAVRAGLFDGPGATLARVTGGWRIVFAGGAAVVEGVTPAEALCRAALAMGMPGAGRKPA